MTRFNLIAVALSTLASLARADDASQIIVGHARFTVITPELIRLEYAPTDRFVDDRSWFAVDRTTRFNGAKIERSGDATTIDTGKIQLTFRDDGKPFSPANLTAIIRRDADNVTTWTPGTTNYGNLGGTLRTLDALKQAVPLGEGVLSRDGWSLLDDSKSNLFTDDWVRSRENAGNLDWYFFGYGSDYRGALKSLTAIGGPIPLPRKYSLGIWYSRYWSFTADAFKQIVKEYAEHGFPLDVMVMDMGWHLNGVQPVNGHKVDTWTGYTWDKSLIPDPAELLKWMHEQGLHVTLNEHPAEGVQPHEEMYADFTRAMKQDPSTGATIPFDAGDKHYLDTFYAATHAPREKEGVDFWWLDWQQYPKTRSVPDLDNLAVLNWYNYARTSGDDQRGESFSRWAGWGDHRYPIHFSGDADTGWKMLAAEVPFTSTAGNVGAFFWSHDIGGHMGGRNEESYARWCQFGALSAALRSHSTRDATTDRRPWNYPDWAEASMKVSFQLRSRLMPYLYSAIHQSTADSVPFIRPLYIDFPNVEAAYHASQEFLFGDDLLVAPIAMPGVGPSHVATQAVWFPPDSDQWFDYFTGERFDGGESAIAATPIDRFPLYVRGGVPLPMQPFVARPGTAPLETLTLRCYPGRDGVEGSTTLYEDDGLTTAYKRGESASTPLKYVRHGDQLTITVGATTGTYHGQPTPRSLVIELPCTAAGATSDAGRCAYDAATFTTRLELPAAPIDVARTITVRASEVSQQQVIAAAADATLKTLLDQPNTATDPKLRAAIAAARGVALFPINQHPYGLGHDVALTYLRNHHSTPESLTLHVDGEPSRQLMVTPGEAVARSKDADAHAVRVDRSVTLVGDGATELNATLSEALPPMRNLVSAAKAEASTGNAAAAIDGSTDGYPGDQKREWVTLGEKNGAWLTLTWPKPTTMTRVLLYDRPNTADHVEAATLTFSDGSHVDVGPLPDSGDEPLAVTFPAKTCTRMKLTVTRAGDKTRNIGLSEIAITNEAP